MHRAALFDQVKELFCAGLRLPDSHHAEHLWNFMDHCLARASRFRVREEKERGGEGEGWGESGALRRWRVNITQVTTEGRGPPLVLVLCV